MDKIQKFKNPNWCALRTMETVLLSYIPLTLCWKINNKNYLNIINTCNTESTYEIFIILLKHCPLIERQRVEN